jgi:hypothetical protein
MEMNKDKSPIDSFGVSLGASSSKGPVSSDRKLQPWNILVCSDLGFISLKPRRIRISEWNEFMASENIVISGTLQNPFSTSRAPKFVEYNIHSMKDFSSEVMKTKLQAFAGFAGLLDSIDGLIRGKTGREHAINALNNASLPKEEYERVKTILGSPGLSPKTLPPAASKSSAVASILSMVDVAGTEVENAQAPHTAIDGLVASFSDEKGVMADRPGCTAYLEEGKRKLDTQLSAMQAQPFFSYKKASWQCLMLCAKAIGRKNEIRLSVCSASLDGRDELLEKLVAEFNAPDASPDIIVWDYPVSFTNAEIDRLARLTAIADRFKSLVIAPLSSSDRLFDSIAARDDFPPVFQDIRFLPFKQFRSMLESRAVCLCAPPLMIPESINAGETRPIALPAQNCWLVILRWIEMTIANNDPFAVELSGRPPETLVPENASFHQLIPPSVSEQAAAIAGMTLFNGKPIDATIDRAKTVIDPEVAGTAYASFAFNLLVNRVARLIGRRIIQNASSVSQEKIIGDLEAFLCEELIACRICTAPDQVSVKSEKEGTLDISLNSDITVGGNPARFSFSLEV